MSPLATMNDTRQMVVFTLGHGEYALPIEEVHEVIGYIAPRNMGTDGRVVNVRGKVVPIFDLAAKLGVGREDESQAKIVIIGHGEERLGLLVDSVDEVTSIDADDLQTPPVGDRTVIESIAQLGDRLVLVLSAGGLLAA
jgi:purine-binding chemotaxis protein CheW